MSVVRKMPRPASFPGHTVLLKKTGGPVVYVGDVIPADGVMAGVSCYVNESETREILKAWGWPRPEEHAKVVEERDALAAEVERLNGLALELEASQVKVLTADEVLAMLSATPPATSTAGKTKAAA